MAQAARLAQRTMAVEQINAALRGAVIDTLRLFIPSLAPYTNAEAFNVILNSPEMTQRSFRAFRDHPDAFTDILRGPENQPVAGDDDPLSCGRTLAQVVALVVQAVAKRYFRAKLSPRRGNAVTKAKPSLIDKVSDFFSGRPSPRRVTRPAPGQGEKLFRAMREHLLFEWQLRLIPHYVGLPVPLVQALGARLLEFKEIEDIQWMVRTGQPLAAPTMRRPDSAAPRSDEAQRFLTAARTARFGIDPSPGTTAEFARLYQAKVRSPL